MTEPIDATQEMRSHLEVFAGRCPPGPKVAEADESGVFGPAMSVEEVDSSNLVIDLSKV